MDLNVKRIKAERIANGLSQEEVARHLGIKRSTYSLKENGHKNWSINNLAKFCDLIGVGTDKIGMFFMQ